MRYGVKSRGESGFCVVSNEAGRVVPGECHESRQVAIEHATGFNLYAQPDRDRELTVRERQIAKYLVAGLSDREVAQVLGVQHDTVRKASIAIRGKLGAGQRSGLLLVMILKGYLSLEDIRWIQELATKARSELNAISP
jgi:DNA-binding NarL/FixJ family response regulator